jgi:hypothetical protein
MSSIKQLQNRLLTKKNSLLKIKADIANAEKIKNSPVLRRLNQEKGLLDVGIRKLDRQLTMEIKVAKPVYI